MTPDEGRRNDAEQRRLCDTDDGGYTEEASAVQNKLIDALLEAARPLLVGATHRDMRDILEGVGIHAGCMLSNEWYSGVQYSADGTKVDALSPAGRRPPESADYVSLLKEAKARVRRSVLYEKFIEHTPLENDIAVWMADFAAESAREAVRPPAAEEIESIRRLAYWKHTDDILALRTRLACIGAKTATILQGVGTGEAS